MKERNGVRVGQRLRDLDGNPLGRVTALYDWGFRARRGLPLLFGADYVVRYDEVRGVRDGELVVARSRRDLFDLAAGGIPRSWRVPTPPAYPSAATPPEAWFVREAVARGEIRGGLEAGGGGEGAAPAPPAGEEREEARPREAPAAHGAGDVASR